MVYYCKCFPAKFYTPILKEISSKNTMIYLVKQKIIGTIEYIVDTEDNPIDEILGITDRAEAMQSTLELQYTEDMEVSRLFSGNSADQLLGQISDPVVRSAVQKLKYRLSKDEFDRMEPEKTKRRRRKDLSFCSWNAKKGQ
jgi:hypothetical protein